jgi:hypothetical protein
MSFSSKFCNNKINKKEDLRINTKSLNWSINQHGANEKERRIALIPSRRSWLSVRIFNSHTVLELGAGGLFVSSAILQQCGLNKNGCHDELKPE